MHTQIQLQLIFISTTFAVWGLHYKYFTSFYFSSIQTQLKGANFKLKSFLAMKFMQLRNNGLKVSQISTYEAELEKIPVNECKV